MDREKMFQTQQRAYREWIASLDFVELQIIAKDIMVCLDYRAAMIEKQQTRDEFIGIMRRSYGV